MNKENLQKPQKESNLPTGQVKKVLITGIAGQDGSYLTEFLISKGYEVHGIVRWDSVFTAQRLEHIYQDPHQKGARLFTYYGDLTDTGNIERLINQIKPDEIYHLAAQSHVKVSFDMPEYTVNADALGTLRVLEAIKNSGLPIKFYMAASSEMFGDSPPPQNENTPFYPKSPYACAKVFSHNVTRLYREAYGIFAVNGILYNHESPRRGPTFVTKKISRAVARIKAGLDKKLYLGNPEAKRDWGFAPEYVEAMWKMLQQKKPEDYVIATGETHSVKEFLMEAFKYAGLGDWQKYVEIDPRYFRPAEVEVLIGDATKAKEKLNWQPKIKFNDLVKIMVDADFRELGLTPPGEGDKILKEKFPNRWWLVD
jgi:GDPmannose 4,6-dehydratase